MKYVNRQIDLSVTAGRFASVVCLSIVLVACGDDDSSSSSAIVAPVVMNDTGVTECANQDDAIVVDPNAVLTSCEMTAATHPGQDADLGRDFDATTNSNADGAAGFSFTQSGSDCVTDNVTGLVWEVKSVTASDARLNTNSFTWYDSSRAHAAGDIGVENGGDCVGVASCDTEAYVAAINAAALCNFTDWRLPSRAELQSIVDYSRDEPGPMLDSNYFPNAHNTDSIHGLHRDWYWSSQTAAGYAKYVWAVSFNTGGDTQMPKQTPQLIRLVRGGS